MPQNDVEIILIRQCAEYLNTPIFLMGADEQLLYYNEPAEVLLGHRFDETGRMPLHEISDTFKITDEDGSPLAPEEIPIGIALRERRPAHRWLRWQGLDGRRRKGEVTAFPIEGQSGRFLGAVAIFWEADEP